MIDQNANTTRNQILDAARELFAKHGYAGTSIADVANQVGTSKAGVYYHFRSKEEILDAILDQPILSLSKLVERAAVEHLSPEQLLSAYIDGMARSGKVLIALWNDLSIQEKLTRHNVEEKCGQIISLLAGPQPTEGKLIRARAAFAVAQTAINIISSHNGYLSPEIRKELLDAALRALGQPPAHI
ncbi:AcrR family transcriptional regulator [Paenibacillus forsythiae]|uniref:AcrR family transcriptional regulator n=1 Tax=Paenibacillus forsythiae TaxID=365616 RepID=A0ABU3H878_9BACL|nr:TetR/AcrR family transcriptional regulator [Paenibacillus forsythiae]MDT3425895.1 AcrR family transcriptional regulator [Paenibacillus forsythiae]